MIFDTIYYFFITKYLYLSRALPPRRYHFKQIFTIFDMLVIVAKCMLQYRRWDTSHIDYYWISDEIADHLITRLCLIIAA